MNENTQSAAVREAVLALRASKGMVLDATDNDTWSVGSFFTNPIVPLRTAQNLRIRCGEALPVYPVHEDPQQQKLSAAWLIENAGFAKGFPGASSTMRLSTKHALAITHRGGGTTAELIDLARTIRAGVLERFGVNLEAEVVFIGVSL